MRPILQTNINFNPGMDKYIHYKMWDEIIYIHTQTSIQQPFQFGNGYVVSSYILLNMWLFIHAEKRSLASWWEELQKATSQ